MEISNRSALEPSAKLSTEKSGCPGFFRGPLVFSRKSTACSSSDCYCLSSGHCHLKNRMFLRSGFCSVSTLNLKDMKAFRKTKGSLRCSASMRRRLWFCSSTSLPLKLSSIKTSCLIALFLMSVTQPFTSLSES